MFAPPLTVAERRTILHAIIVRHQIHWLVAAVLSCAATWAQTERLPSKLKISDTDLASCYELTGKFIGSQLVRSRLFDSPGGRYRAYVEVEAVASKSKTSSDWDCASTSRLFVSVADQPFRRVLSVAPTIGRHGEQSRHDRLVARRSEEHTFELQSPMYLVC